GESDILWDVPSFGSVFCDLILKGGAPSVRDLQPLLGGRHALLKDAHLRERQLADAGAQQFAKLYEAAGTQERHPPQVPPRHVLRHSPERFPLLPTIAGILKQDKLGLAFRLDTRVVGCRTPILGEDR